MGVCTVMFPIISQVIGRWPLAIWLFTDEKWWDIVGPESNDYVKAATKAEAKLGNQVCFCLHVQIYIICA